MDVMDTNAIDELFAPFSTVEFVDNQAGMASPSYPQIVMDNTSTENSPGGKDVWDELDAIEPLLLDLPVDTNQATYTSQPTMDYDQFFPESLGPKMTAIYEPLYDVNSPQTIKEGSAYSPRQGDELQAHRPQKAVGRAKHQSQRVVRTKCPIFPESSTPLSELKSYSTTSLSSTSKSSTVKSDGSYPGTFASDPGQCDVSDAGYCTSSEDKGAIQQFLNEVLKPRKKLYVANHEDEIEKSASLSPVGRCESPIAAMPPTTTKAALKIEIPVRYVKKITDLDRKILKLQAERAKLLEKGQSKADLENSHDNRRGSFETKSSVQIHYYAVGIPELDGACYDEGNLLLSSIGGITNDYRVAINNLCEVCNQKNAGNTITDCLNHMKTLLVGHQILTLHQMDGGLYQLLVQPNNPEMICQDLVQSMVAANELLKITQQIVGSSAVVETRLKLVIETVVQLVQSCEATCNHLGILDERKIQIKNVLEGNQIALETALRLWPKNCLAAKDTLAAITDSMHPMYNCAPRPY